MLSLNNRPADKRPWSYDRRIVDLALLAGLPALLVSLYLVWKSDFQPALQWTLTILIGATYLGAIALLRERVVYPLQTLSNLLAALRDEDYSIRARGARRDDALGEVMIEVNALGESLREQRLGALEAMALLRAVMAEIEVAVFTFDGDQILRLVNRAGEKVMAQPAERLLGRTAAELGLLECLQNEPAGTIQKSFPGGMGRWSVRRTTFRQRGKPHQLLVLADLSRALREEERLAWQRLLRVLGHELNNSLAPIKSIAGSLASLLARSPRPPDWEEDARRGLEIIASRAEALNRFMEGYARIARLPAPRLRKVEVGPWVRRLASLENRLPVKVEDGPALAIQADPDQLDQLLINLLRNAADASLETGGGVMVTWRNEGQQFELSVLDEGPGLSNTANLFVPFFTTKPKGSGIGLALCRQIAEAHGGAISLENRTNPPGCAATLRLPV